MKKRILYILIFLLPFVAMIAINELVRINISEEGYRYQGSVAINSAAKEKESCTWVCHNQTQYCKDNHLGFTKPFVDKIDPVYFGVINFLQSTGGYKMANVALFVVLIPILLFVLFVQSIDMQFKILKIKEEKRANAASN